MVQQERQLINAQLDNIKIAYGFIAEPHKSGQHNAFLRLSLMPAWYYFDRPTNLAFHDLTTSSAPNNLRSLLGLGLKFIPVPPYTPTRQKIKLSTIPSCIVLLDYI